MSTRADGRARCDRCDGDVEGGSLTVALVIQALDSGGTVRTLHFCTVRDDTHERCATRVLTRASLAAYVAAFEQPPAFYQRGTSAMGVPAADPDAVPDVPPPPTFIEPSAQEPL